MVRLGVCFGVCLALLFSTVGEAADPCPLDTSPCTCPSGGTDVYVSVLDTNPPFITFCNCGPALPVVSALIRGVEFVPGSPTQNEYTERLLGSSDLQGLAGPGPQCWRLQELPRTPSDTVAVWVRFRGAPTTNDPGAVIATKLAELESNLPALDPSERALLEARVTSELSVSVLGSPLTGKSDCAAGESSQAQVRNLSPFTTYQPIVHAKYSCPALPSNGYAPSITSCSDNCIPGEGGGCDHDILFGRSAEATFSRETLAPGTVADTDPRLASHDPGNNFPYCCDCPKQNLASCDIFPPISNPGPDDRIERGMVMCGGYVLTDVVRNGVPTRVSPPLWSEYTLDVDVKKDVTPLYSTENAKFHCEQFAADNAMRIPAGPASTEEDADHDGIVDTCDALVTSIDTVAGGRTASLKGRIRNEAFDGHPVSGGIACSGNECFPPDSVTSVLVGQVAAPTFSANGNDLTFAVPDQDDPSQPAEGALEITVTKLVEGVPTDFTVKSAVERSARLSFVGLSPEQSGQSGLMLALETQNGALFDLRPEPTAVGPSLIPGGNVQGIAVGSRGRVVAVSLSKGLELYEVPSGDRLDDHCRQYTMMTQGWGVAVEDEPEAFGNRYVYALEQVASPLSNQGGRIRVVDLNSGPDHYVSIPAGIPHDIELRPLGDDMLAYVIVVSVGSGQCGTGPGVRETRLEVYDLDRSGDFAHAEQIDSAMLGCVTQTTRPLEHFGMAWDATRSHLYVTAADIDRLVKYPLNKNGTLDQTQRVDTRTRTQPVDVLTTRCQADAPTDGKLFVLSLGDPNASVVPALETLSIGQEDQGVEEAWLFEAAGTRPVSMTMHPLMSQNSCGKPVLMLADEGRREIFLFGISGGIKKVIPTTSATGEWRPRRLATQRRYVTEPVDPLEIYWEVILP